MPWTSIVCTRDELYEQVWSAPIRDVATQYGISDVGLAKVCRKLRVPVPGRGYWQHKAACRDAERDPLPPPEEGQPLDHEIRRWTDPDGATLGEEARALLAREQEQTMMLVVPEQLRHPHPLVRDAARILREERDWTALGRLQRRRACLDIKAVGETLGRALRIADTLLKGLEARGFEVRVTEPPDDHTYGRSKTQVRILGQWVDFAIKEKATAVKLKPSSPFGRRIENRPNGKLTLSIESFYGPPARRNWGDGKTQRVEGFLDDFVCELILVAESKRVTGLEFERRERLRREEEKRREEAERLRAIEAHRVYDLRSRVGDWRQAREIREFLDAVERCAARSRPEEAHRVELADWIAWARNYADTLEAEAIEDVLSLRPLPAPPRRTLW